MQLSFPCRLFLSAVCAIAVFVLSLGPSSSLSVSAQTWLADQYVSTASMGLTTQAEIQRPAKSDEPSIPGLDWQLEQLYRASLSQDKATLDTLRGLPSVNLDSATARVIIELDTPSGAKAVGETWTEVVKTANGSLAEIHHAAPIRINADLEAALKAAGAQFETATMYQLQVVVPFNSLETLTHISGVRYVRLPFPVQPTEGSSTSQGVSATNLSDWHSVGYNGTGTTIGIFDLGFSGWQTRQSTNDLPPADRLVLMDYSSAYDFEPDITAQKHGTACAEIAYDMAPGSTIYLYAFNTEVEFANAVSDYMDVEGKRIASLSVGWVNAGPYDGTGLLADVITAATNDGILWLTSAGNQQTQHWSGIATQYGSSNAIAFADGNINLFGPDINYVWNISAGDELSLYLEWNDWNGGRTGNQNHIDYDIELYRWNSGSWILVSKSMNNQCSTSAFPMEAIGYTVPSGQAGYYGFAIYRVTSRSGTTCPNNFGHWLNLHTYSGFFTYGVGANNSFSINNHCNSITIPADSDNSITVGAANFYTRQETPTYGLETFSSFGPRNSAGGGDPGLTVNKPDLVAWDGVNTTSYGLSPIYGGYYEHGDSGFWGTSAAVPHVAGLIAVVWQDNPTFNASQLRTYLQTRATHKGDGGACGGNVSDQNNRYGWGYLAHGNQAPVLDNSSNMNMPNIDEDDKNNSGILIADLLKIPGGDRITDPDPDAYEGIMMSRSNEYDEETIGVWQFSQDGTNWQNVNFQRFSSIHLLPVDSSTRIRFIPSANWNGMTQFALSAWDQTRTAPFDLFQPGSICPLNFCSTASAQVFITINPINDAPVLTSIRPSLPGIAEGGIDNSGVFVSSLIPNNISDVDGSGAQKGIAIYANNPGNGKWQYALNSITAWNDLGDVSTDSALLLRPEDKVRFVPDLFNGTHASLSYFAWDQTSGTAGSNADVNSRGGITAFSTTSDTSRITVTSINVAPVLAASAPALPEITEDDEHSLEVTVAALIGNGISDADYYDPQGIAIYTQTVKESQWQFSLDNGETWMNIGQLSQDSALLLRSEDLLRFIPDGKNGLIASLGYYAWDQSGGNPGSKVNASTRGGFTAFSIEEDILTINVTSLNDAPVFTPTDLWMVKQGHSLSFTVTALDVDIPIDTLTYTLGTNAPNTATLDAASGLFDWTPSESDPPGIYAFTIHVTDNGIPALSDSTSIHILLVNIFFDLFIPFVSR